MAILYRSTHVIQLDEEDLDDVAQDMAEGNDLMFGESAGDQIVGGIVISEKIPWVMELGTEIHYLKCVRRESSIDGHGPGDFYFRVYEPSLSNR